MQLGVIDCKSRFSDWLEIGDLLRINQLFGFEFPIVDLAVAVSSTSFSFSIVLPFLHVSCSFFVI